MRRLATIILLAFAIGGKAQTIDQVRAELQRQGVPHANIVLVSEHRLVPIDECQRLTKERLSNYLDDVFDNIRKIENERKGN